MQTAVSVMTCEGFSAQQGGIPLYSELGFCLKEGAVLVISAGNGVGKTTLLKQLAGLTMPERGTLTWFDTPITSAHDYDGDMLYLGDTDGLIPALTVREQVQYFARSWGEEARLPATIHYLELTPYLDARIQILSAGWRRRVALSRLLLIPALLWLLDEPSVHLDAHAGGLLAGMIRSHAERGGLAIITAPQMTAPPTIASTPVSVLHLQDFCVGSQYM
jgi:heme exporter protein A